MLNSLTSKIAVAAAASAVLLAGTAGTTLALAGHPAPAAAAAPAAPSPAGPHATPKPPAEPAPARLAAPATHDGPVYNGPVTIINEAPQPGSTVYVPVPSSAPSYVTTNQAVVQQYYDYINAKDFQSAWAMGGRYIGGSDYSSWVAGYSTTSWVTLSTWDYYPGYNAVGVTITATQTDGSVRTYSGSYTVSGGAITSASITQTSGGSAPAASGLRYVGSGVYANSATSDSFALAVHQAYVDGGYWHDSGTSQFYAYSSTTGQSYLMTSSSVGNPVVVTGGNGALVQFTMP